MAHTENSIIIEAERDRVFDVTNDIERWPELFDEYKEAKILCREDNKITFQLTNNEGKIWRSSRILDKENYQCTAEREEPKFPFKFMHLKWFYEEVPQGTKMTWIQDFEMDSESGYTNEEAENAINEHSKVNMERIKKIIETEG
ncbi:MAG: SRPBCC family protein [bacterium]